MVFDKTDAVDDLVVDLFVELIHQLLHRAGCHVIQFLPQFLVVDVRHNRNLFLQ